MAHSQVAGRIPEVGRLGPTLAGSTVVLTLALFGLLALSEGSTPGLADRVPYYVLGAASAFAVALLALDRRSRDGRRLLALAVGVALAAFVLLGLGVEGLLYAARNPAEAFTIQRSLYLLSAALVATGLGFWTANHVRELVRPFRRSSFRR